MYVVFCGAIMVYIKYQSACLHVPLSELGHPTPSPASECVSPLGPKWGEQHSLAGEGVGGRNSDDCTESLAFCILRVVYILPYILYTYRSAACTHTVKKVIDFPCPAGMSLIKLLQCTATYQLKSCLKSHAYETEIQTFDVYEGPPAGKCNREQIRIC
jgi:hypothetical protein